MEKRKQIGEHEIELLFRSHYRYLYLVALKYVQDGDIAEDVVQEFFINFWERSDSLSMPDNFKTYARQAIRNISISMIRRKAVHIKRDLSISEHDEAYDPIIAQEETDQQHLRLLQIFELIEGLPERQKQILKLHALEKLTYAQIAQKEGISVNTVGTQLMRAYTSLRKSTAGLLFLLNLFT